MESPEGYTKIRWKYYSEAFEREVDVFAVVPLDELEELCDRSCLVCKLGRDITEGFNKPDGDKDV